MGFASRFLALTAKIGLDLLIGTTRTDEAVALVTEWFTSRSVDDRASELAAARAEAADSASVRLAVQQAANDAGRPLTDHQLDELSLSVMAGLDTLPADAAPDAAALVEQLAARRGTFAVWLDLPRLGGPRHYCHFNWDGEAYRVRDFIGGRIYHPPDRRASESGLTAVELPMTALAVWQACRSRVQCLSRYGLSFPVSERERWVQVLRLMSEVAAQWQKAEPDGVLSRGRFQGP